MKLKRISIFLIFLLIGLSGCEKELDASFVSSEKQLVIQGYICPQDTLIQIAVGLNKVLGETVGNIYRPITDAKVILSEGSKSVKLSLLKTLRTDSLNNWSRYGVSAKEFSIESGKTYNISVSYNNMPNAQAKCTIPSNAVDEKNIVLDIGTETYNGEVYKNFNVKWKDFNDPEDYYSWNAITNLNVDQNGKSTWYGYRYSTYYQTDIYKNGQTLFGENQIKVLGSNQKYSDKSYIEVHMCHTDKTYHDYNISIIRQQQNKGSALPESIALRGNIEGGLGVFAGYNLTKIRRSL
jgi:hypothetical protein